jgi:hypothetical protein
MDDRRSEPRLRIFKAGTIEFGGAGIDCTVRNITATGAALEVASPVGIPHEITLSVPTRQLPPPRLHCVAQGKENRRRVRLTPLGQEVFA